MAEQMRPASNEQAPDPSNNYERSHPEREAGMGRLDNNNATPQKQADATPGALKNVTQSNKQLNAQDSAASKPEQEPLAGQTGGKPQQPDHSMHDEEPSGWDQAPQTITDPQQKRHPRTEGQGGMK